MKFIKISTLRSFVDLNAAICRGASCSLPLARRDAHTVSLPLSLSLALSRFRSSCVRLFKVCVRSAFVYTQPRYSYAATPQAPAYRALLPKAAGRGLSVRSLIAAGQRYRDIVIDDCTVQVVQMRNASLCVLHKTLLASVISCTFDCAPATHCCNTLAIPRDVPIVLTIDRQCNS